MSNKTEILDDKVIKKEEILDYVDNHSANKIGDIYYTIKEDCEYNSMPILNNPSNNAYGDFLELILECLDSNQIYKDNNKIDS